ncbi:class I SAM-dependent methyltransferase [Streptomyces coeruleoprunus]|uniref:Class I SAM-dependent methyltransferase n=1 Tax=Streptomyces coeruleoprunus TaxID=285563 RepID=A0ABV9XAC9_9ACTN
MNPGWRGGDYTAAGDAWSHAAHDVTAHALRLLPGGGAVRPQGGEGGPVRPPRVLDVGTGSGPAALAAAGAGADVTGLDLEPGLVRVARDRARTAELTGAARFVVGDALALPFPDASFDAVLSTFGVMFAPDPARAAAELVRVCRPGGVVAVASWTPDGVMGRIAPTVTHHLPDRPDMPPPPTRWGEPARVHAWFAPLPATIRTRVAHVRVTYPSVAHAVAAFENKPGPLRAHRTTLEATDRWNQARTDLTALFTTHNIASDTRLIMDAPYLLATARRAG